jgi:hypothetical protein
MKRFLASLALFAASQAAVAQPFAIQYTARLTEANGKPLSGKIDIEVSFYRQAELGAPVTLASIPEFEDQQIQNGLLSLALTLAPADFNTLFDAAQPVWIQIKDVTNNKTYPRQQFSAVPYALKVPIDGTSIVYNNDGELEIGSVLSASHANTADAATSAAQLNTIPVQGGVPANGKVLKYSVANSRWEFADDASEPGAGESNTGSSLGAGAAVFKTKNIVDLQFRSITAGSGIVVTENPNDIAISLAPLDADDVAETAGKKWLTATQQTDWGATHASVSANAANWNTAYGWGDHGAEGYLTSVPWASPSAIGTVTPAAGTFTTLQANTSLRLKDADTNTVTLVAPALGANYTLTLPIDDGNNLDVLRTNGAGGLSWAPIPSAPVTTVNGDSGAVVLDAADIAPTATRLWLSDTAQTNYDAAYADRLKWDGGATGLVAATARASLDLEVGTDVQAYDAGLQSISGLTPTTDQMLYTTGANAYAVTGLTAAGRALIDDADASAQRTTLGLGTIATQAASSVSITGGTISGVTLSTPTFANDAISGDKVDGGTISSFASTGIDDNATATAVTINSSGNVAIGTATASAPLHVYGAGAGELLRLGDGALTDKYLTLRDPSNGVMLGLDADLSGPGGSGLIQVGTNKGFGVTVNTPTFGAGSPSFFVDSQGKVGVGTVSPEAPIDVVTTITGGLPATSGTTDSNDLLRLRSSGGATLDFGRYATGNMWIQPRDATDLSVNNSLVLNPNGGNVGIGVAPPATLLDIRKDQNAATQLSLSNLVATGNTAASTRLVLSSSTSSGMIGAWPSDYAGYSPYQDRFTVTAGSDASGLLIGAVNAGQDVRIRTQAGDAMTVDAAGNVGVGTTTPGTKLEVAGQVKITGGSPGANKVLTSDAAGLATWQTPPLASSGTSFLATTHALTTVNTWEDVSLTVALPSAGTYLVTLNSFVTVGCSNNDQNLQARLFNVTTGAAIAATTQTLFYDKSDTTDVGISSANVTMPHIVTVAAASTIRVQARVTAACGTHHARQLSGGGGTGGYESYLSYIKLSN